MHSDERWSEWVRANVRPRYRKRALAAALAAVQAGSADDSVEAAARDAARRARLDYYATSTLVLGAVTLLVTLFLGFPTIIAIFTAVLGYQARHAEQRQRAYIGLGLAALAVVIYAVLPSAHR